MLVECSDARKSQRIMMTRAVNRQFRRAQACVQNVALRSFFQEKNNRLIDYGFRSRLGSLNTYAIWDLRL